ncbi:glutamate--tRNA ligase [Sulfuriferula plumbiphila]|uniref:Glutamate--tRNA ligase n=1 Tax=Sulfuriferula plumbiphila TaxID=171865 RepID=A0A512LAI1_9PROT|nr:glutamate--tRNA ligase [Sulfuriferula plumbiphila]BBP04938.1 glutamate--tRNA ligase [Sulfuriferula plumbiphila]GEP31495.1 glutamate--tRNA ligase [Sulfuriferula plumbiphila]
MIRTRFAPSPTGYLHIGGARTALFSWAYARKHGGVFILRIEDTDLERSTPESVQAILQGMSWLGLDYDEGPFYQMQRMARYKEVIGQLLASGHAYHCYASKEEVETMREQQRAAGLKPRYDGRWRPEPDKVLPAPPAGVAPVVRFKNPLDGSVAWNDLVKGIIEISNTELDDLVIARPDGTPTYNFCVAVDDWDMNITQVIRGDDHVNNTPRQINILKALGATLPQYAHVPMILGADGERLSKRHGAVSVMQYLEDGYLPEALLNYLARLGWAHGDDEVFSMAQFVAWFNLEAISRSPAKFNAEKLLWINQQYLKTADNARLAELTTPFLLRDGGDLANGPPLTEVVQLLKVRVSTLVELADAAVLFYRYLEPSAELVAQHLPAEAIPALNALASRFMAVEWKRQTIQETLKAVVAESGLKMPKIAMPLRVLVTGETQTPSIDATLELLGRETVICRLQEQLAKLSA